MKLLREDSRTYLDLKGVEHRLVYRLFCAQGRYGLEVEDKLGYGATVRDVTTRPVRAEELFRLVRDHLVTPVTLRDVLEDAL